MEQYPTSHDLRLVEKYGGEWVDKTLPAISKLLAHLDRIWWHSEILMECKDGQNGMELELHTGGWSGNEEIIDVLQKTVFWCLYWQKTERGGHYYFEWKKRMLQRNDTPESRQFWADVEEVAAKAPKEVVERIRKTLGGADNRQHDKTLNPRR